MEMHNPAHAGEVFKDAIGEIGIKELSERLDINIVTLERILSGKQAVTADIAIKFAEFLPNTDADLWLRIQNQYDLWQAKQKPHKKVIPLSEPLLATA